MSRQKMTSYLLPWLLVLTATGCAQNTDEHDGPMMNYVRIDDRLATGGHFIDGGIEQMRRTGVEVVIDLRDQPPEGHAERVRSQGIQYVNVPVVWRSPKTEDFAAFRAAMVQHADKHVVVQCQANYRASAFTYMYRVLDGVPEPEARQAMNAIWEPEGTWAGYIDGILAQAAD